MFDKRLNRRNILAASAMAVLAGCTVVPKTAPPVAAPTPKPTESFIPKDEEHNRVALLVPTSGPNAAVGQSIANAANMALLDTNAKNLRVTTYDTGADAADAARRAVADGNRLILGPLLSDNIPTVLRFAKPADVPVISFSNDEKAASKNVFIMGNLPGQSIERTIAYARSRGISAFAALVPRGDYGNRTSNALLAAVRTSGGAVIAMEPYDRTPSSIVGAAQRIKSKDGYGALLIADAGGLSARAAKAFRAGGEKDDVRLLGTELWGGEKELAATPALDGALFATVSDQRFGQFSKSYRSRFGAAPFRIATLGYDAVLLTLRISRDWPTGKPFPVSALTNPDGFLLLDGPLRFTRGGIVERSLEVREIDGGAVKVVSPAPTKFND